MEMEIEIKNRLVIFSQLTFLLIHCEEFLHFILVERKKDVFFEACKIYVSIFTFSYSLHKLYIKLPNPFIL